MALYPLSKQYHIDFSSPLKKPLGIIEVDTKEPLSSILHDCWINTANKRIAPVVNNVPFIQRAAGAPNPAYLDLMVVNTSASATLPMVSTGFAYTWVFEPTGVTATQTLFAAGDGSGGTFNVDIGRGTGDIAVFRGGAFQARTGNNFLSAGKKHTLTIVNNGGTGAGTYTIIVDGMIIPNSVLDNGEIITAGTLIHKVGENATGGADFTGKIYSIFYHIGRASIAEFIAFNKAVYFKTLKPKNPPVYFTAVSTGGDISITEETVNTNYASLDPVISLTGLIAVTEEVVNTNYTSLDPTITLTGTISIIEDVVNTNYTSLDPIIDFTGLVSIVEETVNTNYTSLDPIITLTTGVIEITEDLVNTNYQSLDPAITLTPEPIGIVSTVCFNGFIEQLVFNGFIQQLVFNGEIEAIEFNGKIINKQFNGSIQTLIFNGDVKQLVFNGTIQTIC